MAGGSENSIVQTISRKGQSHGRSLHCGISTMKVIPFFDRHSLHTVKKNDFESFKRIVEMMNSEPHLSADDFKEIVSIAYSMNANGSRRRINREEILGTLKSSETIRQRSPGPMQPEVVKI